MQVTQCNKREQLKIAITNSDILDSTVKWKNSEGTRKSKLESEKYNWIKKVPTIYSQP